MVATRHNSKENQNIMANNTKTASKKASTKAATKKTTANKVTKKPEAPATPTPPKRKELPELPSTTATRAFGAFTRLPQGEQTLFMAHAIEEMRINGVTKSRALASNEDNKLAEGDEVKILSGNHKFIGKNAVVTKVRRVRVFVRPEGIDKSVYLFRSDVAPIAGLDSVETDEEESESVAATA